MTRINVIPVTELSDQWLLAEYRELPRIVKGKFNLKDAPECYCLGKGHVKWAKLHAWWCVCRYEEICEEMKHRGFKVNYPYYDLYDLAQGSNCGCGYVVSSSDTNLNRKRLIEKYNMKPDYYKWTKRDKPDWLLKKQPEVGDIWQNLKTGQKIYVLALKNRIHCITEDGSASTRWWSDLAGKNYIYLNRSELTIKDLFKRRK